MSVATQLIENAVRLLVNFFVMAAVVRYLGPEKFAILSLVLTIYLVFSVFARFGLTEMLIDDFSKKNYQGGILEYTASVFSLKLTISIPVFLISIGLVQVFYGDVEITTAYSILGIALFTQSLDYSESYMQANVDYKKIVCVRVILMFLLSSIKLLMVLNSISPGYFIYVFMLEYTLAHVLYYLFYSRCMPKLSFVLAKNFFWLNYKRFLPVLYMNVVVIIGLKLDQFMLYKNVNDNDFGVFSAMLRLSESWYFVPTIAAISCHRLFVEWYLASEYRYIKNMSLTIWSSLTLAIIFCGTLSYFSSSVVDIVYGKEYISGHGYLSLYAWVGVLIVFSRFVNRHLIVTDVQHVFLIKASVFLLANFMSNYFLIPIWGIYGAIYSTIVSLFVSEVFLIFILPNMRSTRKVVLGFTY